MSCWNTKLNIHTSLETFMLLIWVFLNKFSFFFSSLVHHIYKTVFTWIPIMDWNHGKILNFCFCWDKSKEKAHTYTHTHCFKWAAINPLNHIISLQRIQGSGTYAAINNWKFLFCLLSSSQLTVEYLTYSGFLNWLSHCA